MTLEEKTQSFWLAARLWHKNKDEASVESLRTLAGRHQLTPKLQNRILEIVREHDKGRSPPNGGPLRGPSVA